MTYEVVDPERLFRGRSYSSLVEDWFNWYVSTDADKRTLGQVVFLRSTAIPSPNKPNGYIEPSELNVTNVYADDPLYEKPYANNPHIRVGGDSLNIRKDQAVFVPIIVAYEVARKPYYDWGSMQEFTGLTIDYGDNPPTPRQILIDGQEIKAPSLIKSQGDLQKFRIRTPLFPIIIPEADYGRSIKDFLEESFVPGQYVAIVEGYFVLIENLSPGQHHIYCRASAPRERAGPYVAELLYEINVANVPPPESRGAIDFEPPRNTAIVKRILGEKLEKGEITQAEMKKILDDMKT
jgi:hypothetical protein